MEPLCPSPSVQVVQVVPRRPLVEPMQVTVKLLLFQAVELQLAPLLVVAVVDMATLQVPLVDQVAVAVTAEQVDLEAKVTLEAVVSLTAKISGLAAAAVVQVVLARHHLLQELVQVERVLRFHGFQPQLEQR
jgi:hypothetical protein